MQVIHGGEWREELPLGRGEEVNTEVKRRDEGQAALRLFDKISRNHILYLFKIQIHICIRVYVCVCKMKSHHMG